MHSEDTVPPGDPMVLIVEDSVTQAQQLAHILCKHGYQVSIAHNGKEALLLMQARKPVVVISNLILPEMDGYELCRHIKSDEDLQDVPVILVTAFSNPEDALAGLECGADDIIVKPYDEQYLLARIEHNMSNCSVRRRSASEPGVEIVCGKRRYSIKSDRHQILNLLLSTYAAAMSKHAELIAVQKTLRGLNQELERRVEERTCVLKAEIAERERVEAGVQRLTNELEQRVTQRTLQLEAADRLKGKLLDLRQRDQEEIERLNKHLVRRAAELAGSNKELEAFAYSVSHDLRAPLRHLEGFAELLLKRADANLDETSARYAHAIADAAMKMSRLIEDLLNFSRTSRAEMHTQRVELPPLIEEIQRDLAPVIQDRRISWNVGTFPAVEADPILLRVTLTNLLSNAIKFTAVRPEARIEIGARAENGDAVIFVRDNGAGFDPQYSDKLFGVFQRLHREDEFAGTGIGLATVRRIIHRHGGRVWADSTVDGGATFYFTLPIARG
jgi:signal transduction histidine kinase